MTPPYAESRVIKVGCYVTVNGNYVTFHELNVGINIKTITKAQFDSVSNRELFNARFKPHRGLVIFFFVGNYIQTSADDVIISQL